MAFFSSHEHERSRRGVDTFDGLLTQGAPSTRVVSSSDTTGTSDSRVKYRISPATDFRQVAGKQQMG